MEEFVSAIERGRIKADWEVFHATAGRWLPVTAHPAFAQANASRPSGGQPSRRSAELVLIYPDPSRPEPASQSAGTSSAPPDPAPGLAPADIERVLGRRYSQPNSTAGDRAWSVAVRRPSAPRAPLVSMPQPVRSRLAVAIERVVMVGIILVLVWMAISTARHQRRQADADIRTGPPERRPQP
jgi:hypothetical protein